MKESAKGRASAPPRIAADRVSYVTVGAESAGQRLDNFLLRLARGVPQSHVYRIVRSGEVRVNKARASVDQRLAEGDQIRVPPLRIARPGPPPVRPTMPPVLYEDEHLLAIDKPAGLAAHGGSGIAHGLIEIVRAARPNQPFLELAHRLDRETSGILLLAKSRRALLGLHQQRRLWTSDSRTTRPVTYANRTNPVLDPRADLKNWTPSPPGCRSGTLFQGNTRTESPLAAPNCTCTRPSRCERPVGSPASSGEFSVNLSPNEVLRV